MTIGTLTDYAKKHQNIAGAWCVRAKGSNQLLFICDSANSNYESTVAFGSALAFTRADAYEVIAKIDMAEQGELKSSEPGQYTVTEFEVIAAVQVAGTNWSVTEDGKVEVTARPLADIKHTTLKSAVKEAKVQQKQLIQVAKVLVRKHEQELKDGIRGLAWLTALTAPKKQPARKAAASKKKKARAKKKKVTRRKR